MMNIDRIHPEDFKSRSGTVGDRPCEHASRLGRCEFNFLTGSDELDPVESQVQARSRRRTADLKAEFVMRSPAQTSSVRTLRPAENIQSIQYGRAVAAIAVFLFHLDLFITDKIGENYFSETMFGGSTGVQFFFVISGFIILHVHRKDIDRPEMLQNFLAKRLIRLFPIYWMVVIPLAIVMLLVPSLGSNVDTRFHTLLCDIFLIPREGIRVLQPAWTLQHELVFYLLFSSLIINIRLGIAVMVIWQLACCVVAAFEIIPVSYQNMQPLARLVGHENFGFVFGMAIALAYARFFDRHPELFRAAGIVGALSLVVCLVLRGRTGTPVLPNAAAESLLFFVLYAMVICGLLYFRDSNSSFFSRSLNLIGASSYVLYLIHEPLSSAILKVLQIDLFHGLMNAYATAAIIFVVVIATSVAVHLRVEVPLLERCRAAILGGTRRRVEVRAS